MDDRSIREPYSAPRWRDDPCARLPICNDCIYFGGYSRELSTVWCNAFPGGIPRERIIVLEKREGIICNGEIGFKQK